MSVSQSTAGGSLVRCTVLPPKSTPALCEYTLGHESQLLEHNMLSWRFPLVLGGSVVQCNEGCLLCVQQTQQPDNPQASPVLWIVTTHMYVYVCILWHHVGVV